MAIRPRQFYVYTLSRPSTDKWPNEVFYVGKGTKSRIFDHEEEALRGKKSKKCSAIRDVWAQGGQVQKTMLYQTGVESDALIYEWVLINMVFASNTLTNVRLSNFNKRAVVRSHNAKSLVSSTLVHNMKPSISSSIQDYSHRLCWSQEELADRAGLSFETIKKAEQGKEISPNTAWRISKAFTNALGKRILAKDIEGLVYHV